MLKKIVTSVLLLFVLSVNFASEPTPPPYYRYKIQGNLLCDSFVDLSEYLVVLKGKVNNTEPVTDYTIIDGMGHYGEHPLHTTNSEGFYYLESDSYLLFDSLKLGIFTPDNRLIESESHWVDTSLLREVTDTYNTDNGSGCSSCSVQSTETRIVRYEYRVPEIILEVCD
ncbi:MAG: hypothetical protein K9J12_05280 [Melioribacteraceae bacterium]|nr:hypothetical protein [Melioribacteraceae bacterium]MCF8262988.1 hypothetical protein [Melioribacteraceae bacterium]MCF8430579.1 hypothetical protein [Melioribacteraceae bacterium]